MICGIMCDIEDEACWDKIYLQLMTHDKHKLSNGMICEYISFGCNSTMYAYNSKEWTAFHQIQANGYH